MEKQLKPEWYSRLKRGPFQEATFDEKMIRKVEELTQFRSNYSIASYKENRSTVNTISNQRSSHSKMTRRLIYCIFIVLTLTVGFVSAYLNSTHMASEMNKVPAIDNLAQKMGVSNKNATSIGESVTDKGISMMITNLVYDGIHFVFSYRIDMPEKNMDSTPYFDIETDNYQVGCVPFGKQVDSRRFEEMVDCFPSQWTNDSFILNLHVPQIGNIQGDWSFAIPVQLNTKSSEIQMPLSINKANNDLSIKLKELLLTPLTTQISFDYVMKHTKDDMTLGYDLVDDTGYIYKSLHADKIDEITPDYGKGIIEWSGTAQLRFEAFLPKSHYLRLMPYYYKPVKELGPLDNPIVQQMDHIPTPENPIVLSQGSGSKLIITQIEETNGNSKIHFHTVGSEPQQQASKFWVSRKGYGLTNPFTQDEPDKYQFTMSVPGILKVGDVEFMTAAVPVHQYIPELEMRIDLPR